MVTNQTSAYEDAGSIPGLASMAVSRGVGHRRGAGPELLWLWRRPAATAPIHLLAWELPYAKGMALNKDKKKKKKERKKYSSLTQSIEEQNVSRVWQGLAKDHPVTVKSGHSFPTWSW